MFSALKRFQLSCVCLKKASAVRSVCVYSLHTRYYSNTFTSMMAQTSLDVIVAVNERLPSDALPVESQSYYNDLMRFMPQIDMKIFQKVSFWIPREGKSYGRHYHLRVNYLFKRVKCGWNRKLPINSVWFTVCEWTQRSGRLPDWISSLCDVYYCGALGTMYMFLNDFWRIEWYWRLE